MLTDILRKREPQLGVTMLLISLLVGFKSSDFLTFTSLKSTFNDTSILIILALGQMLVITTRCIDLSVASNIAFTGMIVALINSQHPNIPIPVLMLIAAASGAVLGTANGVFVWLLRIPAIVVTLSTMSIYRGATFLLTNGAWVNSEKMSQPFLNFPSRLLLGIPILSWLAIATAAAVFLSLRYSQWGRQFFTAGGNPMAAFYSGIDVGKVQFYAFVVSGSLAGLCGYLWVSRFAVAYVNVASGFELNVIAACVIGGISIKGGIGSAFGCVLGSLFMGLINNALPVIGISPFWQMAISGSVIIFAMIANSRSERALGRKILKPNKPTFGTKSEEI